MEGPALLLPSEVWNHVFGYLSADDKFNIRACCKYFKKLVDHRSFWKGWTVVLGFPSGSYNRQFWASLRRRGVTSVVVRSSKVKDWNALSRSLPALTTIVMERSSNFSLRPLKDFPNLKRLIIRNTNASGMPDASTLCRPQQLTHLSLCDVGSLTPRVRSFVSAVCQFKELTSLVCHHTRFLMDETFLMVQTLLTRLPKLKHLSLSMVPYATPPRPNQGLLGGAPGQTVAAPLSSLELIGCVDLLIPENAMRLMPGLRSLSVFYSHCSRNTFPSPVIRLNTWLGDLPQLSTLVIVNGPPIEAYVTSIPTTVTSLTLCVPGLSSEDLAAVSVWAPNLLHLHLDPWPSYLGALTARIPRLFPKLKRLRLRHEHVPERDFLDLHQLLDLEYLEVLDSSPRLSELTGKLQALTKHRLHISRFQTDVLSCLCAYPAY